VPLFLIDAHSKNCVLAYESSKTMTSTDDRMRKLQALARQTVLRRPWPGAEAVALSIVMPILHAVILLDRAAGVDPSSTSASDELDLICEAMMPINLSMMNPEASDFLRKACNAMAEKLNAARKLSEAMFVVQQTSLTPTSASPVTAGQTSISEFEFIKRISSGAYARVFLAQKKRTGDIYAIKVIPKTGLRQKNEVRRVLAEKDILLNINSPSMIKFFYSIIGEHNLYLVMEYLPGGDLYSVLQNIGCLDEPDALIYAAQIVSALEFLRNSKVIHRDLKPDNILVDSSGRLRLTDFGLSFYGMVDRSIGSSPDLPPVDDAFVGTPDYTAPEIVMGQPHTFTADYWALGAILYEFLAGVPPFHAETPAETFQKILRGQYDSSELAGFSAEANDLIRSLLCLDPERRLGSGSIDEVKHHPWFARIDWDHLEDLHPPFVPELQDGLDTSYFEERYSFHEGDEHDILEDVQSAIEQESSKSEGHRSSLLSVLDELPEVPGQHDIDAFSSIAVHRLRETTNENARQLRLSRGEKGLPESDDEDRDAFLNSSSSMELTPMRRRSRRRMPRCSLSPKAKSPGTLIPSFVVGSPGSIDFDEDDM
jgi:serine/threonine protein kinase